MDFLAPLMLLGAAGIAVPIAIHLIGRRRAPVVRFAAVDFLLGSNKRVARRLQLRELLLLAARVLVCLAIPLALAKPLSSCAATGPQIERGPQAAVIVLDNSLTSSYVLDGDSLLERARARAHALLDQMGPEADVAIVPAAAGATAPEEFSRDHLTLRDVLDGVEPSPRPADTYAALGRAAQLLTTSKHQRNNIFLLTPLTAESLMGEPPWRADQAPPLTVIDVTGGAELSNVAVVEVEVTPDPNAGSRGVSVVAEIANYSAKAVDERAIRLRIDGQVVATASISLRPGERASKRFAAALPADHRVADVVVELDHDALALDDQRYVRAELRDRVRALMVDGDPRTVRHEDELFYLETALRPGDRDDSGIELDTTTADELEQLGLDDYDVIVLANVRALEPLPAARLQSWVRDGGGLLVTVGDRVNADAYNAAMAGLLPQQLRDPITTAYGARGAERDGRALRLAKLELTHPILTVFGEQADGLRDARFRTVTLLGPTTRVEQRKVIARYTNGAAALVEARSGEGRLLLFTSTIDRDWNDLSIHPGYLPLVQRAVRYLARRQDEDRPHAAIVGRRHPIAVPAGTTRVEIVAPGGRRAVMEGERVAGRKVIAFTDTDKPGFYRVAIADASGDAVERELDHFAVNLDPRGSDVRRPRTDVTADDARAAITAPDSATGGHRRRVELWHAIAVALLGLLLVESLLTARR